MGEKILKSIVTLLVVGVVVAAMWYLSDIVIYVVASAVLSLVGRPMVVYLQRLKVAGRNVPITLAAAITLVVMWVVVGGLLALFLRFAVQSNEKSV